VAHLQEAVTPAAFDDRDPRLSCSRSRVHQKLAIVVAARGSLAIKVAENAHNIMVGSPTRGKGWAKLTGQQSAIVERYLYQ